MPIDFFFPFSKEIGKKNTSIFLKYGNQLITGGFEILNTDVSLSEEMVNNESHVKIE